MGSASGVNDISSFGSDKRPAAKTLTRVIKLKMGLKGLTYNDFMFIKPFVQKGIAKWYQVHFAQVYIKNVGATSGRRSKRLLFVGGVDFDVDIMTVPEQVISLFKKIAMKSNK